jgi:hypothetical protein
MQVFPKIHENFCRKAENHLTLGYNPIGALFNCIVSNRTARLTHVLLER